MSDIIEYLVRYTTDQHRPVTPIHGPILYRLDDAQELARFAGVAHPGADVWIEKTTRTVERLEVA